MIGRIMLLVMIGLLFLGGAFQMINPEKYIKKKDKLGKSEDELKRMADRLRRAGITYIVLAIVVAVIYIKIF